MSLFHLKTLRRQFLGGFLVITLLIVMIGLVTFFLFRKIEVITQIKNQSSALQLTVLNTIKNDNDFLDYEATNEQYFKEHTSEFLLRHDSQVAHYRSQYQLLSTLFEKSPAGNCTSLHAIDTLFQRYDQQFRKLEELVFNRGFKDFGMEGSMRVHAHELERLYPDARQSRVLMLRRYEKDFLLRHDSLYVDNFTNELNNELQFFQKDSLRFSSIIYHLINYRSEFNQRVAVERQIGLTSKAGLRTRLNDLTHALGDHFVMLGQSVNDQFDYIIRSTIYAYVIFVSIVVLLSIFLSAWVSKKLSEPIVKLAHWVDGFTNEKKIAEAEYVVGGQNELELLKNSFRNLIRRTRSQMNEIQEKSNLLDRKNQELVKLNHELDHFLYSTAHDLRSPLSSLSGLIHLMKKENTQATLELYFEMMNSNVKRQEEFIAQIVSYAKNNKLEIMPEELDIKKMVLEIFQSHEFIEGAVDIQKYITINQAHPFYCDRNRIQIIFNNLISNAIRYSDRQKGEERLIDIRVEIEAREATIVFSDNGLGIEEHYLGKIFNMFYRASHNSKGSGLGLFILKEAVIRLGGKIAVESKLHIGTTFTVRLPNYFFTDARNMRQALMEGSHPALN